MLNFNEIPEIYLACGYTDLRKSIDGYTSIIQDTFSLNPMKNAMFIFCNKHRDKIKIIYWDKDGFWLLYKRLEESKFKWPRTKEEVKLISKKQLEWLLDGLDIDQKTYHHEIKKEFC
jgi:transposase